jgi:Tfp pilus assembly protein PilX
MIIGMRMMRQDSGVLHRSEKGIALVTTLVILLIMTVLGMGAVAVTALENRIAGFQRIGESANSAAESCVATSVNIIKQTVAAGTVPAAFYATANDPVPALAAPSLSGELTAQTQNDTDSTSSTGAIGPDYRQQINGYDVRGDIDFMYRTINAGEEQSEPKVSWTFRIDCVASPAAPAVGAESRVVAIYLCSLNGGICKPT